MTQAYNLSQLGNKVNTSGQLDPATGLSTQVPVANGGTGLATLTANNVILGNGTASPTFVAPGTAGNSLVSNGTTWISGSPLLSGSLIGYQIFTSTGNYQKGVNNPGFVIVYVVGGGGGATVSGGTGGTSSFGSFVSATGGAGGNSSAIALGGTGSGGNLNINGSPGEFGVYIVNSSVTTRALGGMGAFALGYGNGGTVSLNNAKQAAYFSAPGGGGGAMEKIQASSLGASEVVTIGGAGTHNYSTSGISAITPNPTAGIVIVWEYQ